MNNIEQGGKENESAFALDYYLDWEWPEHIETALRRLMWISLVELAEGCTTYDSHAEYVEWLIATHPDSPKEVLDHLANTERPKLLERIAENPQTCGDTLARLAECSDPQVRLAVSEHPNTPPSAMEKLLCDSDLDIRYRMAENPNLPAMILQALAADENGYVALRARKTMVRRNPAAVEKLNLDQRARSEQKRKFG